MTSNEISLSIDIVAYGNRVHCYFHPSMVSKDDFTVICTHLLRGSRKGITSLSEYANDPPVVPQEHLTCRHQLLTVTALRLMAAAKAEEEIIRAKQNKLSEKSEEIRNLRRDVVTLLTTILDTAPDLLRTQEVQMWLKRNQFRCVSQPPSPPAVQA